MPSRPVTNLLPLPGCLSLWPPLPLTCLLVFLSLIGPPANFSFSDLAALQLNQKGEATVAVEVEAMVQMDFPEWK